MNRFSSAVAITISGLVSAKASSSSIERPPVRGRG
jgi:hypothetical protein